MDSGALLTALFIVASCILGLGAGWIIQHVRGQRQMSDLTGAFQGRLDEVIAQRNEVVGKLTRTQSQLEKTEDSKSVLDQKLDAVTKKSAVLAKNVRILQKERENTKIKLSKLQAALTTFKQQTRDLQNEFNKTREFYKRELLKSVQKRKDLEKSLVEARAEQEAFAKAVESSSLEHGSEENMVMAAQLRLGQLEVLERNINKLETENESLREDVRQLKQQISSHDRDVEELDQLKLNNRQLVQCVEALESSRKAHEADAQRYREKADQSEMLSDTLRLKLDDLEKNFEDIEKQQSEAIKDVRKAAVVPMVRKQG